MSSPNTLTSDPRDVRTAPASRAATAFLKKLDERVEELTVSGNHSVNTGLPHKQLPDVPSDDFATRDVSNDFTRLDPNLPLTAPPGRTIDPNREASISPRIDATQEVRLPLGPNAIDPSMELPRPVGPIDASRPLPGSGALDVVGGIDPTANISLLPELAGPAKFPTIPEYSQVAQEPVVLAPRVGHRDPTRSVRPTIGPDPSDPRLGVRQVPVVRTTPAASSGEVKRNQFSPTFSGPLLELLGLSSRSQEHQEALVLRTRGADPGTLATLADNESRNVLGGLLRDPDGANPRVSPGVPDIRQVKPSDFSLE